MSPDHPHLRRAGARWSGLERRTRDDGTGQNKERAARSRGPFVSTSYRVPRPAPLYFPATTFAGFATVRGLPSLT